ncbi:MAG: type II secretion system protein [Planctomycetes bacterium]|nr:type II secretion system protein [Planctomycetota bacterium]
MPRSRGFTLIEVLVVVAIIALLVAILVPSLAQARKQTRRTLCASNLHEIGLAMMAYHNTYRQFPPQAQINVDAATGKGQAFGLWTEPMHRTINRMLKTGFKPSADPNKVKSSEVFYCPEVTDQDRLGDILGTDQVDAKSPPYVHITYFYAGRLHDAVNDPAKPRAALGETSSLTVPSLRKLYVTDEPDARAALMSDMLMFWGGAAAKYGAARWRINHGPWYQSFAAGQWLPFEGTNLSFGDGHVEWKNAGRFPKALRSSASFTELMRSATLIRDSDLSWW